MVTIANPIYDSVFKFLMEDERVARTILSALLKIDIVKTEVRPHEYSNVERDSLSVFRIDFAATVREADGTEHLLLVELQKTWVGTETLRFRQYLGRQYSEVNNMRIVENENGRKRSYGIPMVTIYLLGHCVGDIEEPVLYVRRKGYDYYGNEVTKGLPDPFVDSLTHDAVIVQIPLLHGQVNNRLDKVLSVFDQTRITDKEQKDTQTLTLEDDNYDGDDEMMRIVHRLVMAAADQRLRRDMDVEDEFFSILEQNETEIQLQKKQIAKQTEQLQEQSEQLEQQTAQLEQQTAQLEQQSAQLEQQSAQLSASIRLLSELKLSASDIAQRLGIDLATVERLL